MPIRNRRGLVPRMLCVNAVFDSINLIPVMMIYYAQISWSGCKDSQTSADTVEAGSATGAMSYVGVLSNYSPLTPFDILCFTVLGFHLST
jgi:hypothetical protein